MICSLTLHRCWFVQGAAKLNATAVSVIARDCDRDLVQSAIAAAQASLEGVSFELVHDRKLPATS